MDLLRSSRAPPHDACGTPFGWDLDSPRSSEVIAKAIRLYWTDFWTVNWTFHRRRVERNNAGRIIAEAGNVRGEGARGEGVGSLMVSRGTHKRTVLQKRRRFNCWLFNNSNIQPHVLLKRIRWETKETLFSFSWLMSWAEDLPRRWLVMRCVLCHCSKVQLPYLWGDIAVGRGFRDFS